MGTVPHTRDRRPGHRTTTGGSNGTRVALLLKKDVTTRCLESADKLFPDAFSMSSTAETGGNASSDIPMITGSFSDCSGMLGNDSTYRCSSTARCRITSPCMRPNERRALSAYMHWLTITHVRRLHRRNGTVGEGHIYQERYRTVAVASDIQFLNVCRYVEANPVRAGLVDRADEWPYSSASGDDCGLRPRLDPWPIPKPECWADLVGCP
jgi:hypothetical protein